MVERNDDTLATFAGAHWQIQPRWVKALTVTVAVPAWLVLMASAMTDSVGRSAETVALSGFVTVALLQLVYIFRAYWRMDL